MEKDTSVILDYTYYKGEDQYSDGDIEDTILDIVQKGAIDESLYTMDQWAVLYHLSSIRENILEWYPIESSADVLEVGAGCGALTGLLSRKAKSVTCIELSKKRSLINAYRNKNCENVKILVGNFQDIKLEKKFDYITLIGVWEYAGLYIDDVYPYSAMLVKLKQYLKPNGKLIIAIENKTGMKYWNGAPEDHTGILYGGINDYTAGENVRTFSENEIREIVHKTGFKNVKFYYPLPDYKTPSCIYSEEYMPKASNIRMDFREYSADRMMNFEEAKAYDQVCYDKVFPYFANSFVCILDDEVIRKEFVKYSPERKDNYQICTEITACNDKRIVTKRAATAEAVGHIQRMKENEQKWKGVLPKLSYLDGEIQGNTYVCSYITGNTVEELVYPLRNDVKQVIKFVKSVIKEYLMPNADEMISFVITEDFKTIFGQADFSNKKSLKKTNIDIIFSNLIMTDNHLYNIDYEWVYDFPIPYEYVIWRGISQLYNRYVMYFKEYISKKGFLKSFEIVEEDADKYETMEKCFHKYVCNCDNGSTQSFEKYRKKIVLQKKVKDDLLKFQSYNHLLSVWIEKKQIGKNLSDYLAQKGYKNVAIYGMANLGKLLLNELENSAVQVKYAIDRNCALNCDKIAVILPEDDLAEVDAIIVTACFYFDDIEKLLSSKIDCPILSLENILSDI